MTNPVHEQQAHLQAQIGHPDQSAGPGAVPFRGHAVEALRQVLQALGWRGEERHLMEALPHFDEVDSLDEFRAVLARLNFDTSSRRIKPRLLDQQVLPCLMSRAGADMIVILTRAGEQFTVYDISAGTTRVVPANALEGDVYLITPVDLDKQREEIARHGWLGMLTRRFKRLLLALLGVTFVTNMFALAVPIYIMNVYDKVIGTKSTEALGYFFAGIGIVVLADVALRLIRARAIAYLGTRYDALLGPAAFQQIMSLPLSMTESVPIGSQISRLRQFEGIREVFTGTLASTVLDIPFMLVFLAAIIIFGGAVAWVPITLIALYGILAAVSIPMARSQLATAGEHRSKTQNFLIELTTKQASIHDANAQSIWLERYRKMASDTAIGHFRSQQFQAAVQTIAQAMVMIAGVATLAIGTVRVMNGDMTLGALIAVMAMVWRVLNPVQSVFLSLNRVSQALQSFRQINHLMRLKVEREPGLLPSFYRKFLGAVNIGRVSFRYSPRAEPALMGLSLDVPPGQLIAVTGPSGAGKSTLIKIMAGLYPVQAGAVQLDGLDLRQIDVGELRHAIAYVPQKSTFFYGTVAQNIRLAHPEASDQVIALALREARVDDYAEFLPEGAQTRLTTELQKKMPAGLKQRLMLARAYAKQAPLVLMDEPANGLDEAGDRALTAKIAQLRGKSTVFMVTHRPSHMRLCDRVLYLEAGQLLHDGKPEQVLPLIMNAA